MSILADANRPARQSQIPNQPSLCRQMVAECEQQASIMLTVDGTVVDNICYFCQVLSTTARLYNNNRACR